MKSFLFYLLSVFAVSQAFGQGEDFCNAVTTITRDAPNQFRNIKGKLIEMNANAATWHTGIKVPGTIASRFVSSMGLFYEGALLQTQKKEEVLSIYNKYKSLLNECLGPQGYTMSEQPNFYPGMGEYKKLVFMPAVGEDTKVESAPSHITMEATYNKDGGQYTVVMFIFEH